MNFGLFSDTNGKTLAVPVSKKRRAVAAMFVCIAILLSWGLPPTAAQAGEVEVGNAAEFYKAFATAPTNEKTVIKLKSSITLSSSGTNVDGKNHTSISLKPGQGITLISSQPGTKVTIDNDVNTRFFTVPQNASLTFGDGIAFRGKNKSSSSHQVDVDGGTFAMKEGSEIFGSRNMLYGAIYVHNGGKFVLDGGTLRDNQPHPQSSVIAGAVTIGDQGIAELNSGTIKDNGTPTKDVDPNSVDADYKIGGAIAVRSGGTLNVNDGVDISSNSGNYGGAILAFSASPETPNNSAQAAAVVNIKGGRLSGNTAQRDGGGVFAAGNTLLNVSGGVVSKNKTRSENYRHGHGGGIAVWDGCFLSVASREPSTKCETVFGETGPNLPDFKKFSSWFPAQFNMSGGTIEENSAGYTGGGLYLATANAKISGGSILRNTAGSYGGGITVPTQPYSLEFTSPTLVSKNGASGETSSSSESGGGGIWSDSFGSVRNGASVFENTSKNPALGPDFAASPFKPTDPWKGEKTLLNRVNGGGLASWGDKDGKPLEVNASDAKVSVSEPTFAAAKVESDAQEFARANSRVRIEENTSLRGGGIGTSGTVIFPSISVQNLDVVKKWRVDGAAPDKDLKQDDIPTKSLTFTLVRVDGEKRTRLETFTVTSDSKTIDQGIQQWAHTLVGLPTTDANGAQISYKLVETVPAGEGDGEESREFAVDAEALTNHHLDVINYVKLACPSFTVVDSQGTLIDGYGLQVLKIGKDGQESEVINGVLDSQNPTLVDDLPAGTYRVKATAVPEGFLPFADFTFTIAPDRSISVEGVPSHVKRTNEEFSITASKKTHKVSLAAYDADDPQRSVNGGQISVTDASGNVVFVGALADNLMLESLPSGEYRVAQTEAIDGYVNFEAFTFVVAADGTVSLKKVPEGAGITVEGNRVRIAMTKVDEPTPVPSVEPTVDPSPVPSVEPTVDPSPVPSGEPTVDPSPVPSGEPTDDPSPVPGKPSPESPADPGAPGDIPGAPGGSGAPGKGSESSPLPLPRTGAEIAATAGIAALLVLGGVAVLAIRRKSRSDR